MLCSIPQTTSLDERTGLFELILPATFQREIAGHACRGVAKAVPDDYDLAMFSLFAPSFFCGQTERKAKNFVAYQ